ncbi:MAG: dUTP diphosphatase [Acidimicrobiia bacterium]
MPHDSIKVSFTRLDPELPVPVSAYIGDAAVDLHSRVSLALQPGERAAVPTGLAIALPEGYAAIVIPRSGHALRSGVGLVNSPGLIDSGYRGEIKVIVINHGEEAVSFERGERIAQLAILPIPEVQWVEVETLDETQRGSSGFGSSGS